jgi:hypothetical protein
MCWKGITAATSRKCLMSSTKKHLRSEGARFKIR